MPDSCPSECKSCLELGRFRGDWCHQGGNGAKQSNYGWPHVGTDYCVLCGRELADIISITKESSDAAEQIG